MGKVYWFLVFVCSLAQAARPDPIYKTIEHEGFSQLYYHSSNTPSLIRPGHSRAFIDEQSFDQAANPYRISCSAKLYLPTKNPSKPLPTLVISHAINGFKEDSRFKELGLKLGMAVLMIDHYGQQPQDSAFPQRGYIPKGSLPKKLYEGPSFDSSVIDLYEAFRVLQNFPQIDKHQIVALGISRGAIVVDRASRLHYRDKLLNAGNFAGFVMVSPFILDQEVHPKLVQAPSLYLLGGGDYVTPYKIALDYSRKLLDLNHPVRTIVYPDGYHTFPHKKPKRIPEKVLDITQLAHKYTPSSFTLLSWEAVDPNRYYNWSQYPLLVGIKFMNVDYVQPELKPFSLFPHQDSMIEIEGFLKAMLQDKKQLQTGVFFKSP